MKTGFRESFNSDLAEITDAVLLRRIQRVIEQVEAAQTFQQIPNLKRLDARRQVLPDPRGRLSCRFCI